MVGHSVKKQISGPEPPVGEATNPLVVENPSIGLDGMVFDISVNETSGLPI